MHLNSVCVCVCEATHYGSNHYNTHIHILMLTQCTQQAKEPLWGFGTQPIMLLVAYGQWKYLEPQWNVNGSTCSCVSNIAAYGRLASIPYHVGGLTGMC